MSENAVDYSKDVCDFCESVFVVGEVPHFCMKMPIEHLLKLRRRPSYDTLVRCFGDIRVLVPDSNWSGDIRYLLKASDGRWGILITGYGSCSSCDAIQACDTPQDYDELRKTLHNRVQWFDSAQSCFNYIKERDWEAHYSYNEEETSNFIELSIRALVGGK